MPIEYQNNGKDAGTEPAGETALIPKSLLMGKECKPGDKITLEVTHVYEDEVEVAYPKKEPKEPMEEANDDLESRAMPMPELM